VDYTAAKIPVVLSVAVLFSPYTSWSVYKGKDVAVVLLAA
jgi:hypothetical protein